MSSLKKNFGYQMAYRVLTVITPLITSPIISRALGADQLGVYSATQAFVNYFMFIAMLGIEKYGQRTIAAASSKVDRERLFCEIYTVQFCSSILSIISYIAVIFLTGGSRTAVQLIQSLWVFSCLFNVGWFFFGCEEFQTTVIRSLAIKILTVVSIALLIRNPEDLALYALIMAGGAAAGELLLWFPLTKRIKFKRPSWDRVKPHILPIFRLFIPVIALSVYHIMDKTMLDVLSTEANVGWYYAVDKIVNIPVGLIMAIGTVMMPRVTYVLHNENEDKAKRLLEISSELTIFLTSAITFGVAAISKEFIPFFFGPGYEPCVELMYLFSPVLVIKALSDVVCTQYLIPSKKDNIYTAAVTCGAVANVIFNALFIPSFGAKGAVFGTLAAEFVVLVVQISGCLKAVNFIKIFARQSYYILIGAVMALVVRLCANYMAIPRVFIQIIIMVIIGAAVYLAQCVFIWLLRSNSIFSKYAHKLLRISC